MPPALAELLVADPPDRWAGVGFSVSDDGALWLGDVRVRLGLAGSGIVGWCVAGLDIEDIDGLVTRSASPAVAPGAPGVHPNGAVGLDHVVAVTPDLPRTVAACRDAGLDLRRIREAGDVRQAFFVVGPALLEVVGPVHPEGRGPARFWGLTAVVSDLDAAAELLGDRLGPVRDAVQPGRRIATVRRSAGLSVPLALMTPRPAGS